jgi:hypothetical protein
MFAMTLSVAWFARRQNRKTRAEMLAEHPACAEDLRCSAAVCGAVTGSLFDARRTAARLAELSGPRTRALVACAPGSSPPDVPDVPDEPLLVSGQGTSKPLHALLAGAGGLVLMAFSPGSWWFAVGCAVAAVLLIAIWGWWVFVCPSYARLAPGIIQVLRYRPFARVPQVRDYPLDGRTVVVVESRRLPHGQKQYVRFRLTVRRDGQTDRIEIDAPDSEQHDEVWRILLSTAPTPPLDDKVLVG